MDWLLAALALFNLVSMVAVFWPRAFPRRAVPWVTFGTALLATELSWIWLPLQVFLAWLLCEGGALDSGLGVFALLVLLGTTVLSLGVQGFAAVNVALVAAWIALAVAALIVVLMYLLFQRAWAAAAVCWTGRATERLMSQASSAERTGMIKPWE